MSYKSEDVAEAQRLVEELSQDTYGLKSQEKVFIEEFSQRFAKYGESTYITHHQLRWLREIYERVIG